MQRTVSITAALVLALAASQGFAAGKAKPKAAPAPAVEPAPAVDEALTPAQLEIAPRVFTGKADCEFAQNVDVSAVEGKPGFFHVAFGKLRYLMTPQETTTGAVRLEDRRAGAVWIQIPVKSMLMDAKAGRRLVDACTLAPQRTAAVPAEGAPMLAAAAR